MLTCIKRDWGLEVERNGKVVACEDCTPVNFGTEEYLERVWMRKSEN